MIAISTATVSRSKGALERGITYLLGGSSNEDCTVKISTLSQKARDGWGTRWNGAPWFQFPS